VGSLPVGHLIRPRITPKGCWKQKICGQSVMCVDIGKVKKLQNAFTLLVGQQELYKTCCSYAEVFCWWTWPGMESLQEERPMKRQLSVLERCRWLTECDWLRSWRRSSWISRSTSRSAVERCTATSWKESTGCGTRGLTASTQYLPMRWDLARPSRQLCFSTRCTRRYVNCWYCLLYLTSLEYKREDYQNCSVPYLCLTVVHNDMHTHVICFVFLVSFVVLLSKETGWEEHLRSDLFCVKWDIKT